jgi:restriction endonuclease S subunit
MNSRIFKAQSSLFSTSTINQLTTEILNNIEIAYPEVESEQTAIAAYLDAKTAQIDRFVAAKQKLIALLKEERTGIINQAVTKGLNPNVPMKPSGIEWLYDASAGSAQGVPAHWEVKKLKYVVSKIDEPIEQVDFLIAVENIESNSGRLVGIDSEKKYQGQINAFKAGDVIFNKLRPYLGKVYHAERDGGYIGELLIIRPNPEMNSLFLFFRLFSRDFIQVVNSSTEGTKMPRANWEDFIRELEIPVPPIFEQNQIAAFIQTETTKIDTTISKIEKEIELMQEYRTALINEVVTGKICVV